MSQPPVYSPAVSFQQEETNAVAGRSTVRTPALDAELASVHASILALVSSISYIQRDDKELRDQIVRLNSLSTEVLALLGSAGFTVHNPVGWLTATDYPARDIVTQGTGTYVSSVAHTSGVFATDLAAGKWALIFDSATLTATAIGFTPTGNIAASNVQDALAEVDSEKMAKSANLSDVTNAGTARANLSVPSKAEIQNQTFVYVQDTGTADALVVTPTPAFTAYATGQHLAIKKAGSPNSIADPTINVSGLGTKKIFRNGGQPLVAGSMGANGHFDLEYDATHDGGAGGWELKHQLSGVTVIPSSIIDAAGDIIIGEADNTPVRVPHPYGGASIINGNLALSVAAGALTVALKGLNGADPSATNPVFVRMPQGNPFDGTYLIRKVTAALSMVVSSGSTLGHLDTIASPVYFYLIDNGGALELAVSNKFFGGVAVVTTAAEGGAGAADSQSAIYSTTARTSVPAAVIQRWKSTQTTAGTWAATTGERQLFPFPFKAPTVQAFTSTGANTYTKPWDLLWAKIKGKGGGGAGGGAANSSGTSRQGGGGGEGGYFEKTMAADLIGATETFTIGAAAAATSFGAHATANAGSSGSSGTGGVAGGAGGSATGGDINITGQSGLMGLGSGTTFSMGGDGGGDGGAGMKLLTGQAVGANGVKPGSGGGGTASIDSAGAGGSSGFRGEGSVEESYV